MKGKVALGTRIASRIGRGIARAFGERAADLMLTVAIARALEDVCAVRSGKWMGKVAVRALDLRDPRQAGKLVEAVKARISGRIRHSDQQCRCAQARHFLALTMPIGKTAKR